MNPFFTLAQSPEPNAERIATAIEVVTNPQDYHDRPLLRRMSWMALMAARGCRCDQRRLAQMPVEMAR